MTDVASLLKLLTQQHIEFILIGGVAAGAHGSARSTLDLDVVYLRTRKTSRAWWPVSSRTNPICAAHHRGCRFDSTQKPFSAA